MKQQILWMAKEVKETRDSKEAALLLQSGDWVAVNAAFQGDEILWLLIRTTSRQNDRDFPSSPGTGDQHHTMP